MAVNLSMRNVHDPSSPRLHMTSSKRRDPPALLHRDHGDRIIADAEGAIRAMTALRALGVKHRLDDFGIGYSSLAYLNRLAGATRSKIDRSFVIGMSTDENSATIVRATVDMGHALGLEVVAEGVEDELAWARVHRRPATSRRVITSAGR